MILFKSSSKKYYFFLPKVDEHLESRPETSSTSRRNSASGSARPITSYGRKPVVAQHEKPDESGQLDLGGEGILIFETFLTVEYYNGLVFFLQKCLFLALEAQWILTPPLNREKFLPVSQLQGLEVP